MRKFNNISACKFCNHDLKSLVLWVHAQYEPNVKTVAVQCPMCMAHGPLVTSKENAILAWNDGISDVEQA